MNDAAPIDLALAHCLCAFSPHFYEGFAPFVGSMTATERQRLFNDILALPDSLFRALAQLTSVLPHLFEDFAEDFGGMCVCCTTALAPTPGRPGRTPSDCRGLALTWSHPGCL